MLILNGQWCSMGFSYNCRLQATSHSQCSCSERCALHRFSNRKKALSRFTASVHHMEEKEQQRKGCTPGRGRGRRETVTSVRQQPLFARWLPKRDCRNAQQPTLSDSFVHQVQIAKDRAYSFQRQTERERGGLLLRIYVGSLNKRNSPQFHNKSEISQLGISPTAGIKMKRSMQANVRIPPTSLPIMNRKINHELPMCSRFVNKKRVSRHICKSKPRETTLPAHPNPLFLQPSRALCSRLT